MSAKEDLRVLRTRKLLSDTLLDMMENESIEHISVMDLCNLAMINRGTFYKHFEDKYSLLGYSLDQMKRELYSDFSKQKLGEDSPQNAVRRFFSTAIQFFFDNSNRIANIIKHNMCGKVITAIEDTISSSLSNLILGYMDRYTIKVPLPIITQFLSGGLVTTVLWCINNKRSYTVEEFMSFVDFGLITPLFERI